MKRPLLEPRNDVPRPEETVLLSLIVILASNAVADEKKDKGKKRTPKKPTPTQQFVGKMELTEEQKTKVAEIDKQFADRFAAINKALEDILTEEQKTAQKPLRKKAAKEEAARKALKRRRMSTQLSS